MEGTIGDTLILVPTLRLIENHFSGHHIDIVSFTDSDAISAGAILAETFPEFGFRVIRNSPDKQIFSRFGAWLKLTKLVRRERIETLIYAFRPENQRASKRAGWHKMLIEILASVTTHGFKVDRWPSALANHHEKENLIAKILFERVAMSLDRKVDFADFDHRIELCKKDADFAVSWLKKRLIPRKNGYFIACVTGKTKAQRWPLDRYKEVLAQLNELHDLSPVFIGSASDADVHEALISELGFGFSSAGLSLMQSCGLMQTAEFYLGNDTGPMHLAAAQGVKCIVLQSSRNLKGTWDPLGEGHLVQQSTPDCIGCGLSECRLENQICLTDITVNQVVRSCNSTLSKNIKSASLNI